MTRLLLIFMTAATVALPAFPSDENRGCSAASKQCELQIRSMLAGRVYLGVRLAESRWGLLVKSVVPDSPAAHAGLKAGDRIFTINGRDLSKADIADFKRVLEEAKTSGRVYFGVARAGSVQRIFARLETMSRDQIEKVIASHLRDAHDIDANARAENR
jgi:predicted metalloprotease with PDZ domain